jgi:hypothetical protein
MGDAGQGGPVRLAILLVSIAGLIGLGVQTARGPNGASASHGSSAEHGVPGKVIAVVSRRRVPVVVRQEVLAPRASGAAAIRVAGSTYLLGGTRRGAHGSRVPVGSVLRSVSGAPPYTRVAKLPTPVTGAAAAAVGDRLYAIGGRLANGSPSDAVQEYDIATEHSVVAARLPEPVSGASALTLDGFVYLLGGVRNGAPSATILRFNPWSDAVARAGRLPVPATGGVAGAVRTRRGYLVRASVPGAPPLNFVITLRAPIQPRPDRSRTPASHSPGSSAAGPVRHSRGRAG